MAPQSIEKSPSFVANGDDKTNEMVTVSLIDDSNDDVETKSDAPSFSKGRWFSIDAEMIPAKLTYLFWGGLIGTHLLYLNPFLESIGLPKDKSGIITGIGLALGSITGPFWGMLTDVTGSPKMIMILICIGSAVSVLSVPFIAAALPKEVCVDGLMKTGGMNLSIINSTMSNTLQNSTTESCSQTSEDRLFYTFLVVMGFGSIFYTNIQNYMDATALKTIKSSRKGATYGAQRIFGAIGATIAVQLTAALLEVGVNESLSPFSNAFFVYVPYALIAMPTGCFLIYQYQRNNIEMSASLKSKAEPIDTEAAVESPMVKDDTGLLQHLCRMFGNIDVVVFMFTVLISGIAFNLFIYWTISLINEQLQVTGFEAGIIMSGLNIANIIMFPWTGPIIKLLKGPKPAIVIGLAAHCIRNVVMSYTTNYWVMLFIQLLHTLDFALLFSAMMEYVHHISPQQILTTMIMILQSLHFGFAPFLINIVGGVVYQKYDGKTLFRSVGLMSGVWTLLLVLYYGVQYKRRCKKNEPTAVLIDEKPPLHESY